MVEKKLLKPEQLSDRWQIPPDQIRRLARRREIPALKIGHYWRFSEVEIEKFERGEVSK